MKWIGANEGAFMMQTPYYRRVMNPFPLYGLSTGAAVFGGAGHTFYHSFDSPTSGTSQQIVLHPGEGFGVRRVGTSGNSPAEVTVCFTVEDEVVSGVYPSEGDVDNTASDYGPTGTEYTGTFAVPSVGNVVDGVFYGAAGTEFEGTYVGGGSAVYPVIGGSHVIQSEGGEDG